MHKLSFFVLIHSLFDINLSAQTISDLSHGFTDLQDFLLKDVNEPFRKLFYSLNGADRLDSQEIKKNKRYPERNYRIPKGGEQFS